MIVAVMIDFMIDNGSIKVSGLPLWLDSRERRPLNFISHAHADHIGTHRRIICTPATLELVKTRTRVGEATVLEFGQSTNIANARITLYPAGHILGSAQILIEKNEIRLLYTGDFRLAESLTAERCEMPKCDVLLMECTYGHPRYAFPPRKELNNGLRDFVESCFDDSLTPVVLAYSLGKAQEAIKALEQLGYGALAHPAIWKICKVYRNFGVEFHQLSLLGKGPIGRRVVVFPPQRIARYKLNELGPHRTVILTGWTIDNRAKNLFGADEMLPFSDHCDYLSLLSAVEQTSPKKIYTHHGDADGFAMRLRAEGFDAEPLAPLPQQSLF